MTTTLKKIYYDPASSGSFGGVSPLLAAAKKVSSEVFTRKDVQEWLRTQDTYTLHRPVRWNFSRNRILVSRIDDVWQMDLVDMQMYKKENDSFAYLLTCIDVFSKYAWVRCIKQKTGVEIIRVVSDILSEGRIPGKIQTDKGTKFLNARFQLFLRERNIGFYTTFSETKASVVERFNRTLKSRMWRYFTSRGSHRYVDVIQQLVSCYNASFHRSIGLSPNKVTATNSHLVFERLFPATKQHGRRRPLLNVGDQVRISKTRRQFDKGYLPNWTDEVFVVSVVDSLHQPHIYRVKHISGRIIQGTFYAEELQKIVKTDGDLWMVDRIVAERGRGKQRQVLVKWRGYSDEHNTWIKASDLVSLNENDG